MAHVALNAWANHEETVDDGKTYDRWHNQGWCGRLDLAQKRAAQCTRKTLILEAQVGKPPKK
jgi:hypothetical protein